jgi:hypothetical protein
MTTTSRTASADRGNHSKVHLLTRAYAAGDLAQTLCGRRIGANALYGPDAWDRMHPTFKCADCRKRSAS